MPTTLHARRLLTSTGSVEYPTLTLDEEGCLIRIESGAPNHSSDILTAAFFDIHVHGAVTHDLMAASEEEIHAVGRFLAKHGVAHYLPTTVTAPLDATLRALERLADAIEGDVAADCARPVGIHLEGPFVSHAKRGVHPPEHILSPDPDLFDRLQEAARGHIRLLTLAPELPRAVELTRHVVAQGVRVSLGHSNALAAEALAGIAAGAASATHTFNAMRPLDHREPGILGTVLDTEELFAELICDGVHVHPALVRLWLRCKGAERGILVTDGISATGMPDGPYTLGNLAVEVRDGVCMSGGVLAGSTLTMDRAVENLQRFTAASLETAVRLASRNPATMLGMETLGHIAHGKPVCLNRYDDTGRRTALLMRGRKISA